MSCQNWQKKDRRVPGQKSFFCMTMKDLKRHLFAACLNLKTETWKLKLENWRLHFVQYFTSIFHRLSCHLWCPMVNLSMYVKMSCTSKLPLFNINKYIITDKCETNDWKLIVWYRFCHWVLKRWQGFYELYKYIITDKCETHYSKLIVWYSFFHWVLKRLTGSLWVVFVLNRATHTT